MNAQSLAKKAYSTSTRTIRSPRAIEYEAIARITHELKMTAQNRKKDFASFAAAVHKNNQLWTTLAADVANPENQLSSNTRAQIFYLAEFAQRHSAQVLSGTTGVAPLLEINTAILRGLREGKGM